jgi:uncharacterized protein (TIGR02145 family)
MKITVKISVVILSIFLLYACKKDKPTPPVVTTRAVTEISPTTATSGGDVINGGGVPIISTGVCWNIYVYPTIENSKTSEGGGLGSFNSSLTQLSPNTLYYIRAYATNSAGTGYGNSVSFTTLGDKPASNALNISNIQLNSATLNGSVNPNSLSTTVTFEYGLTTTYGSTAEALQSPVSGDTYVNVSADLSGLTPGTTYHFRIKATNELGTTDSNDLIFKTYEIADADNNLYYSVTIGTQTWMSENLKTTRYRNGDLIGTTIDVRSDISGESTPKYQWAYDGDEKNVPNYGRLYTWFAATDSRDVCPTGWHVPTDDEWTTLTTYLGGENVAGGKLKETGTTHWFSTNSGVTNESGFTALPGGCRIFYDSSFFGILFDSFWWSSTSLETGSLNSSWNRVIGNSENYIQRGSWLKLNGFSIRCIKD